MFQPSILNDTLCGSCIDSYIVRTSIREFRDGMLSVLSDSTTAWISCGYPYSFNMATGHGSLDHERWQ